MRSVNDKTSDKISAAFQEANTLALTLSIHLRDAILVDNIRGNSLTKKKQTHTKGCSDGVVSSLFNKHFLFQLLELFKRR